MLQEEQSSFTDSNYIYTITFLSALDMHCKSAKGFLFLLILILLGQHGDKLLLDEMLKTAANLRTPSYQIMDIHESWVSLVSMTLENLLFEEMEERILTNTMSKKKY